LGKYRFVQYDIICKGRIWVELEEFVGSETVA
jgi:hypothetical protein